MRHWTLARLGFDTYAQYLGSAHWRGTREAYAASDRPQDCALCGADGELDLHHLTYERLGRELLTDLVRLCRRCHAMVHVLERRGDASISLEGIVSDDRAESYFAQRAEAITRAKEENRPLAKGWIVSDPRTGHPRTLSAVVADQQRSADRLAARKQHQAELKAEKAARRAARDDRPSRQRQHSTMPPARPEDFAIRVFEP